MSKSVCGVVVCGFVAAFALPAAAETVTCAPSGHAFARGYCAVARESGSKGWVRAKASLDRDSATVRLDVDLETDNVKKGPCGTASVALLDDSGHNLTTIELSKAVCRGGKPPGAFQRSQFPLVVTVSADAAQRARSLVVSVAPTGSYNRFWNVALKDVLAAIKVIAAKSEE